MSTVIPHKTFKTTISLVGATGSETFCYVLPFKSITFARAPVTGDHWRRTSNLIKSVDKK